MPMYFTVENDIEVYDSGSSNKSVMEISLPYQYTAREYQQPLWTAAFSGIKRYLLFMASKSG